MTSITETQPCIVTEEFTYVTIMEVYMKMAFFFFIQLHRKKKKRKKRGLRSQNREGEMFSNCQLDIT